MRKALLAICAAASLLAAASAAPAADEQWLQYKITGDQPQNQQEDRWYKELRLSETAPADVAMPRFDGDMQLFTRWETPFVKDGFLWVALDGSKEKGAVDCAYIDTNCDGSLADEAPIKVSDEGCGCIGPVKIVFSTDDGPMTYHLLLVHQSQRQGALEDGVSQTVHALYAFSGCYYEGDVTVGGKKYKCDIYDYNANGTFNDTSMDPEDADRIKLATDQLQRFYIPGKYLQAGGAFFHAEPARDGASISFSPVDSKSVPMGKVRVASTVKEIGIAGEMGLIYLDTSKGAAEAPAGEYVIHHWLSDRRDKSGVEWKITGRLFPRTAIFEVVAGEEAELDVGEPVTAELTTGKMSGQYWINSRLLGKMGETIKQALVNGGVVPIPTLTIANKAGTFTRDFKLEYG